MRTLVACAYFMALGYCIRAWSWDKDMVKVAGKVLDQIAIRWTVAADDARRALDVSRGT